MDLFIKALKENDLEKIKSLPKSDHHNHATRGGNIRDFISEPQRLPHKNFKSLEEMQLWYETNIKYLFKGKIGFINRLKSAFKQAKNDGVTTLSLSFGIGDINHFNNISDFIETIDKIQNEEAQEITFIPEISFSREHDIKLSEHVFDELLEYDFFKSIDLVGDDNLPVDQYKNIYKKGKRNDFTLKAHLGEFGNSQTILEGIKVLDLDHIQHGINAVSSELLMNFIKDRDIQLNICPSSNIALNRAKSYNEHQIKKLFHEGIRVTINTDDMLIFDQSVSQEYLNLYNNKCLSGSELNAIRKNGLNNNI